MKEYAGANRLYRHVVAKWPDSEQALWSQADLIKSYLAAGDDPNAEIAVEKLLADFAENPLIARAIHDTAYEYRKLEEYDRADQLDQFVIDNWPGDEQAMWAKMDMAKTNVRLGNDAAVEAAIESLIADFNDNPELATAVFNVGEEYYYRAFVDPNKCQTVKSVEDINKAKDVWEKIIVRCPQSESIGLQHATYFLAVSYRKLGQHDKAVGYYQNVVDNWPKYQYAWSAQCLIGECYEGLKQLGKMPESAADPNIVKAYKAVIEEYPDCSLVGHACLKLGNIYFKASQWDEAATYFGLFLEKSPEDVRQATALYHLGETYEEMGESDTAAEVYRMFLEEANPADRRVAVVRAKLDELGGQK